MRKTAPDGCCLCRVHARSKQGSALSGWYFLFCLVESAGDAFLNVLGFIHWSFHYQYFWVFCFPPFEILHLLLPCWLLSTSFIFFSVMLNFPLQVLDWIPMHLCLLQVFVHFCQMASAFLPLYPSHLSQRSVEEELWSPAGVLLPGSSSLLCLLCCNLYIFLLSLPFIMSLDCFLINLPKTLNAHRCPQQDSAKRKPLGILGWGSFGSLPSTSPGLELCLAYFSASPFFSLTYIHFLYGVPKSSSVANSLLSLNLTLRWLTQKQALVTMWSESSLLTLLVPEQRQVSLSLSSSVLAFTVGDFVPLLVGSRYLPPSFSLLNSFLSFLFSGPFFSGSFSAHSLLLYRKPVLCWKCSSDLRAFFFPYL